METRPAISISISISILVPTVTEIGHRFRFRGSRRNGLNNDTGIAIRTDFLDSLVTITQSVSLNTAVLYANMVLRNLMEYLKERQLAWGERYAGTSPPTDYMFHGLDFELNEKLLARATREGAHFDLPTPRTRAEKTRGVPGQPKPPGAQKGANNLHLNKVLVGAKNKRTTDESRTQPCFNFTSGRHCSFFDAKTSKCPFAHERPDAAAPAEVTAPSGKKKSKRTKTPAPTSDAEELEEP